MVSLPLSHVQPFPPSSNTGGNSPPVAIDWLSFTFPFENAPLSVLADVFSEWFGCPVVFQDRKRGMLGFSFSADVVVPIEGETVKVGLVAWGGIAQASRVYVSLPGGGCALIHGDRWPTVQTDLEALDARLTRVDLACDDMEGVFSVDVAAEWYRAGDFNAGGRAPSHSTHGEWLVPGGKGRTLYVGKSVNGKMLRVYEKGKQLGDEASPWVRWELQLGNKDRVIPLNVLTRSAHYFAGGYACLSRVVDVAADRVRTIKATVQKSIERLVTYARLSYGRLIHVMLEESQGDLGAVIAALRLRGVPASLSAAWSAARAV
jgi:phage replication initiation protein